MNALVSSKETTALDAIINDPARLAALDRTGLLDSAPEPAFDRLTRLASQLLKAPVAVVSLIDDHRQFFKSIVGLDLTETPLSHSFCKHVVALRAPLVVPNARLHPLVCDNPVIEAGRIFAYLGIPLETPDGQPIGSLCAIDHEPREWTDENQRMLEDLAEMTMSEIALRMMTRDQAETIEALRESEELARSTVDALTAHICILDHRGVIISVNESWRKFAVTNPPAPADAAVGVNYLDVCDAAASDQKAAEMATGIREILSKSRTEFVLEYPCHSPTERRWFAVRVTGFGHGTARRVVVAHKNITERKVAEDAARDAHRKMLDLSRIAGMAEVATSVLHNVGNVLNSANISIEVASSKLGQLKTGSLTKVAEILTKNRSHLPAYFASEQGGRLPEFLAQLAEHISGQQSALVGELDSLRLNVEHINQIVAMQQSYASAGGMIEEIELVGIVGDALALNSDALLRHGMEVTREDDQTLGRLPLDRHKTLQILVNLIRNAKHAMQEVEAAGRQLTIRTQRNADGTFAIMVSDQGVGISAEQLPHIFEHGFTTKKDGHGFGLHASALAARQMGGELRVESGGRGRGATFTLRLPLSLAQS